MFEVKTTKPDDDQECAAQQDLRPDELQARWSDLESAGIDNILNAVGDLDIALVE